MASIASKMMNEIANECTVPFEYEDLEQDGGDDFDCAAECSDINVTEEESAWTKTTVGYLLEECLKKKKDLHDPRHRRNKFFGAIREQMIARGFLFSAKTLEKKFYNLKKHFCTICQNRDRGRVPARPITWPYYDKMMEIFAEELEIEDAPTMASLYPDPPPPKNSIELLTPKVDADPSSCESLSDVGEMEFLEEPDYGEEETPWTHKSVVSFLRECCKRKYDLWDPQIRRRKIFNDIRQRLRLRGYKLHPESLDRKLRNMKKHFQVVTESAERTPTNGRRRRITWPYYNYLKDIYGKEMENRMTLIKKAARGSKVRLPPPSHCVLPEAPTTAMKFRPIAPKIETSPGPPLHYMAAQRAPPSPASKGSKLAEEEEMIEVPQTVPCKFECAPLSPGDFDRSMLSQEDDVSQPATFVINEYEAKPINFEETLHNDVKQSTYVGERLRFSLDIMALEERRTIVAEKMLEEFRESNRIRQKRLEFNRIKLEYIKRKKKNP